MSNLSIRGKISRRGFLTYSAAAVGVVALGIYGSKADVHAVPGLRDPKAEHAVQAVMAALESHQLVALGEAHQLQEEHDFIIDLLKNLKPGTINDIVVEFGSAGYQDVMDRFTAGQPVEDQVLRQVWRNTLITGANPVWDAPVYERFFRTVRALNQTLPAAHKLRVLLGDPAIDWENVRRKEDWGKLVLQRDAHYAGVVEREVLQKGRKALLIAGTSHLLRGVRAEGDPSQPPDMAPINVTAHLDAAHPGSVFVIDVLMTIPGDQSVQADELRSWPKPGFARLAGTWLGVETVAGNSNIQVLMRGSAADAVLYLGKSEELTASRANPALYMGGAYAEELERRGKLLTQWGIQGPGDPLQQALKIAKKGPRYFA
ncbi:ChaN family lipoprotein [Dictyobacter vulcani]|nr:ChaN family lipoprotein [Dictyobacter vulcani]